MLGRTRIKIELTDSESQFLFYLLKSKKWLIPEIKNVSSILDKLKGKETKMLPKKRGGFNKKCIECKDLFHTQVREYEYCMSCRY